MSQPSLTERLGIAGSGAIAAGLARLAAARGEVVVWARSAESEARARREIGDEARITTHLDTLRSCSFVVEAVVEDGAVKRELLGRLGALARDDAIIGSTTSSLAVADLAEASGRPDRFVGLHVFNPVEKMDLVELAYPGDASPLTRVRARELCASLGKTTVEVPDVPGFVVNRLLFPYLFSAVRFLEQHPMEPEAVDTCMKLGAAHPMGPLALLDFVGLDVAAAIGESIGVEVPDRVRELVAAGALGRKTGAGFYEYPEKS
ncbi:MAG: 3-hydroxybutyryl-CoA dehydrogenase [Thermoleophilaceae bacterium]|nr:3-hydroxybutyryl-CoA dehydrogenase [Thermoleophilaceae bacterium]